MTRAEVPHTVEVADGVFAYVQLDGSWYLNNTGFLTGRRGVIAIDAAATEARTRALLDTIAGVTDQPVRTLVNTHHHGDHTYGNHLFAGATIVGHERTREAVLAAGPPAPPYWTPVDWGEVEVAPPFLTYADRVTLYRDDLRVECRYVGSAAHTTNDSIVWIPDLDVLFCGDLLFNGGTPFLLMGSIDGAIDALEALYDYPAQTIVPGHGPVVRGRAECAALITHTLGYLRFVRKRAVEAHAAGLSPLEAARATDLGAYAGLLDPERLVGNLHRAYAELDDYLTGADFDGDGYGPAAERGRGIDTAAAFADMIAYNGGKPLACHA
ncbi:MAG TPA: MBL fold metallo-hydrolase [Streptosporangiaceae bacterium]|jgi:cyclase